MSGRLLQLAWRNLWRNPRRTLITLAGVALGYTLLLFLASLLEGLKQTVIENGTRLGLSHMQVHASGYYPDRSIYETLGGQAGTDVGRLLAAVTAEPQIQAAAPRVYGYGLVSYASSSAGVEFLGVVPAHEEQVTVLHTRIVQGSYLTEKVPNGVVIGDTLASAIGARVGAELVLLTQAVDGSMGNDLYTIVGIFHTGFAVMDHSVVLMRLSSLQELLHLVPERIHEIGVLLVDATKATAVASALEARLSETLPVRVRAWPELVPELAGRIQFNRNVNSVIFFFVVLVAVVGVMNTMLMAVFERTRELGMLMALGMRPVRVVGLIVIETGSLVGIGLMVGAGLGAPLLWYLQAYGLDLRRFISAISIGQVVVDPFWYGRHDFSAYSRTALKMMVMAFMAALYPALRAARLRPVEAIQKR